MTIKITTESRGIQQQIRELTRAIEERENGVPNLRDYGWERFDAYEEAIETYHAETRRLRETIDQLSALWFELRRMDQQPGRIAR
jgi:flagellar biosynthesis chaperone FliJ